MHYSVQSCASVSKKSKPVESQLNQNATKGGVKSSEEFEKQKLGHRRIDSQGEVSYKRVPTNALMSSIQLGIAKTVSSMASKPHRDLLLNDFIEIETFSFPPGGSKTTPSHRYNGFNFQTYAPLAFHTFRALFSISAANFLRSICTQPLKELSNPGASGSIFYISFDDKFIIKTVQRKEVEFIRELLPCYYMIRNSFTVYELLQDVLLLYTYKFLSVLIQLLLQNLNQNPYTLLPKFFGLFCYQALRKNIRLLVMNNLLPQSITMHEKYDIKGSTHKRMASKQERIKCSPTLKDLDFSAEHPKGLSLNLFDYEALMKTISQDCRVLESCKIMDYSLLVGIHNLSSADESSFEHESNDVGPSTSREKVGHQEIFFCKVRQKSKGLEKNCVFHHQTICSYPPSQIDRSDALSKCTRCVSLGLHRAAEKLTQSMNKCRDFNSPSKGVYRARNQKGERLLLYVGIIDILQHYGVPKKLEYAWKSLLLDKDISVCHPTYYAQRFLSKMKTVVFCKADCMAVRNTRKERDRSVLYKKEKWGEDCVIRDDFARFSLGAQMWRSYRRTESSERPLGKRVAHQFAPDSCSD